MKLHPNLPRHPGHWFSGSAKQPVYLVLAVAKNAREAGYVAFAIGLVAVCWLWFPGLIQANVDCKPKLLGVTWQDTMPTYHVAGVDLTTALKSANSWKSSAWQLVYDEDSSNVVMYSDLPVPKGSATFFHSYKGRMTGFTIMLDPSQVAPRDQVAMLTHEFGHVLGLEHSSCASSIMFPAVFVSSPSTEDQKVRDQLYPPKHLVNLPIL